MKKRMYLFVFLVTVIITGLVLANSKIDIKNSSVSLSNSNNEYIKNNGLLIEKVRSIRPETNWKLYYNRNMYLEGVVVGEKESEISGTYSTSNLLLVQNGKTTIVEKECYGFGRVAWNAKGTQFIYIKVTSPPADYSMGDVYLVTLENGVVKDKKLIVKNISSSDFRWAEKHNYVAFADFETIYILDTISGKVQTLTGIWAKDVKKYEKGGGYPRMCGAFVWLNNDNNLFFTYYEDLNNKNVKQIYTIHFK